MNGEIIAAIAGSFVTVATSVFVTIRHFSNKQGETQKVFLDHLEKKNGHFERVTKNMTDEFSKTNTSLTKQLSNLNVTLAANTRLVDRIFSRKH
jgi:predicted PurR-regulated permease PerM|tara:strand:+ start:6473 stop:6754 length:282 start_codon:yes stop_codon:yes gene_type:complete